MNKVKCTKCLCNLKPSLFYKDTRKRNGLESACKLCRTKNNKK